MPDCLNEQRRYEIEAHHTQEDLKEDAMISVNDELFELLNSNGLGNFYSVLSEADGFDEALETEARARNPHIFQ